MRHFLASILLFGTITLFLFLVGCPTPATQQYTLTYTAGANGTISGASPQTVSSGGSGTAVTAVANAGYRFVSWTDSSTQNPRTDANVTANISVTASFALSETIQAGTIETFAGTDFAWCPPGTFEMGRYPGEQDSYADEDPQHEVTLTQGFWMGKYQVTQAQWQAVMGSNPSYFQGANAGNADTSNWPVEQVSWDMIAGAGGFLDALNAANPGMNFRLPTEAEWEYACRAGTATRFYWGDDSNYTQIGGYAWYIDNSTTTTHPVGQKIANAWNLFDMSGNVWEWCQDWYADYAAGAASDPQGPSTGDSRVLRGGSWYDDRYDCRSAFRYAGAPDNTLYYLGFRVVRTP